MKIFDTMPFARELLAPTYSESFRREGAAAAAGEVTIGEDWALALYATEGILPLAGDHLQQFFEQSLGVELDCCGVEKRIVLDVDPELDGNPETHLIRVSDTRVEITGAGPQGVLQGVFRLENLMKERGGPFLPLGEEKRTPLFKPHPPLAAVVLLQGGADRHLRRPVQCRVVLAGDGLPRVDRRGRRAGHVLP
jgi:hypothetical protein